MKILLKTYIYSILLLFYAPIITLIVFSFNDSEKIFNWEGFTFDWYVKIFSDSKIMGYTLNSLELALYTFILTLLISIPLCLNYHKLNFRLQKIISFFLIIQIIIPEIVMGISFGLFFKFFTIKLSFLTLLISHVTFSVGFFSYIFISNINYQNLINHNRVFKDLGLNLKERFKIHMQYYYKPVLSSLLIIIALSLDNFIISFFTNSSNSVTIPVVLFSSIRHGIDPILNAAVVLILCISLFSVSISFIINKNTFSHAKFKN